MKAFDPSEPAILPDRITGTIVAWTGEEAAAFRHSCVEREDGTLAWNGYEFDGWAMCSGVKRPLRIASPSFAGGRQIQL
jgi:hypothetical protein